MSVPAAGRRSAVQVQHFGAAEKAVYWAVVFEGQHLVAVLEAAA